MKGHGFQPCRNGDKLLGLQPLGFAVGLTGILRDCTPDSNSELEMIQSGLHSDMQRVAEMSIPPRFISQINLEKMSLSG